MRILVVGDVVGRPGRTILKAYYNKLIERFSADFTVVNAENAAGGIGLTPNIADSFFTLGVDVLTSGNHIWDKQEILEYLDHNPALLRPLNYPDGVAGSGIHIASSKDGRKLAVLSVQGRLFMSDIDCPFQRTEQVIEMVRKETRCVLIDFHAEATSEKIAFARHFDGRVSAVVGTHTHVQTADEQILPGGTAYITDLGMTGPHDSVIGVRSEQSIERFIRQTPNRFQVAKDGNRISFVSIEIDDTSGLAKGIERFSLAESDI